MSFLRKLSMRYEILSTDNNLEGKWKLVNLNTKAKQKHPTSFGRGVDVTEKILLNKIGKFDQEVNKTTWNIIGGDPSKGDFIEFYSIDKYLNKKDKLLKIKYPSGEIWTFEAVI